jgi:hypothetical protein
MGQTIPRQHPAVVLRSHYVHLRALLAVALCAVVALAATVVILAVDDNGTRAGAGSAAPGLQITKVGVPSSVDSSVSSEMAQRRAAVHGKATPLHRDSTRVDGGPDEGTRGITSVAPQADTRPDGGPDEGTRGILMR